MTGGSLPETPGQDRGPNGNADARGDADSDSQFPTVQLPFSGTVVSPDEAVAPMNPHPTFPRAASVDALEPRRLLANVMLKDIGAGELHGNPSELTVIGQTVYFVASADAPVAGTFWELWRTDGTPAGTRQVTNVYEAPGGDSLPWADTDAPSAARVSAPRARRAVGDELWYYDVRHWASQNLLVTLNRLGAEGQTKSWDLGSLNLALNQQRRDPRNVDGQVHVYLDGDEFARES